SGHFLEPHDGAEAEPTDSLHRPTRGAGRVTVPKRKHKSDKPKSPESGCSSPEPDHQDSSGSERHKSKHNNRLRKKGADLSELQSAIESIKQTQEDINSRVEGSSFLQQRDYIIIIFLIFLQVLINYIFK
uniref:Oxysterol binding protein like 8 n=1 Tax=Neolamprologus brichardi TaxID=32507 RepID=A0A3Q4MEQ7_NEOBR